MAWFYLLLAGAFEVAWAIGLKSTQGFTRLWPSVYVLATGTASVVLLAQATKHLPIGTAYAVWTGIGAIGTATLGMILFGESRAAARLACIAMIVAGVIGLKLFSQN
ncbi:MAG: quaternary ammonium compound efflux SMR transporter SugE [Acidobacteria bacterium]|nr:quaternary ammonium compound efflux SMR transporter SugE [Acidobacteriota bacterium]MCL5288779.1 quaternary ammonium compound efflux SMR transporter SugE [Acidobacteriota bacterium]